jgi:hypothetical protein
VVARESIVLAARELIVLVLIIVFVVWLAYEVARRPDR